MILTQPHRTHVNTTMPRKMGRTMKLFLLFVALFSSSFLYAENILQLNTNQMAINHDHLNEAADLSISGPSGIVTHHHFTSQQDIVFDVPKTDGLYQWQISYTPNLSASTKERMQTTLASERNQLLINLRKDGLIPLSEQQKSSGTFRIDKGNLALTVYNETVYPKDNTSYASKNTIEPNDLIVKGSACMGGACLDAEDFSPDDTIKLKRVNTRLLFEDTSIPGEAPSNDWRLTANDDVAGSGEYFSISDVTGNTTPFKIDAGAKTDSLRIASDGKIGFGTSIPALKLHITSTDTPGIRLEQDAFTFGPYKWDVAANEANFFVRDVISGSNMSLRIRAGARNNALHIDSEGNIGIGINGDNHLAALHVRKTTDDDLLLQMDGNQQETLTLTNDGDMTILGSLNELSSFESKENFSRLSPTALLEAIAQLSISSWNYKHQSDDNRHIGPMAEEFYTAFGFGSSNKKIRTGDVASVALAAAKALQIELSKKDQQIDALEQRLSALESLLSEK